MDFNDPKEFDDILVSPDPRVNSIGSKDFDNPKVNSINSSLMVLFMMRDKGVLP